MTTTKKKTFLVLLIVALFLTLRLWDVGLDMANSDAGRWHRRSEKFLAALKTGDLRSTYQHYQPGVTIMWLNALVKQVAFSYQLRATGNPQTLENTDWFPTIHGISKGVVVVTLLGLLLYQMFLVKRLFSLKTALLYGFFMAVEPYVLGIDRWFHLTSLETYFGFSAFLSFLVWLQDETLQKNKILFLAAVLWALSCLSKITSLILGSLFLLIFVIDIVNSKKNGVSYLVQVIVPFGLTFLVTFVVLFPALWVDPVLVFSKFYDAVTKAVGDDVRSIQISGISPFVYYPLVLIYKLSPITLVFGILAFVFSRRLWKCVPARFVLLYLAVYYTFLTLSDKKIDRYVLVLLPALILLVSVLISDLGSKLLGGIVVLCLGFTVWVISVYYPVYSAYYSPLFGGTTKALDMGIYENNGEYFSDAARYLNTKGRDKSVFVPDGVESFLYYYKGNLQRDFDDTTDFVVRSIDIDRKNPTFEGCSRLEKTFGPTKTPVVFVYVCD